MAVNYRDYIPPEITQAGQAATQAGAQASALGAAGYSFASKLRDALNKKLNYNKDIIQQQGQAQADYFASPSAARAKYVKQPGEAGYVNPIQAEALVAGERAQAYAPYASLTGILGQRMGQSEDIIREGTGAFSAEVAAKQGAAQIAQQAYQQLLGEYQMGAGLEQQEWQRGFQEQQAEWQREQAEWQRGLQEELAKFQKEQAEWEKPWQEKLWQYALSEPYYKPTAGGSGDDSGYNPSAIQELFDRYTEQFSGLGQEAKSVLSTPAYTPAPRQSVTRPPSPPYTPAPPPTAGRSTSLLGGDYKVSPISTNPQDWLDMLKR